MVRPPNELDSLRFSRLETNRLVLALLFSLLVHLVVWGGYEAEKKTGWLKKMFPPARHKAVALAPKPVVPPVDPAIYLDVSQASAEAPKQAKYYSDKNSRAANPEVTIESDQPKLNGRQKNVPQTEDVPKPVKAKPTPPTTAETKPEDKPAASGLHPGALQPGKPADNPDSQPKPRPRTVREALAQQEKTPSLEMQQEGGVRQHKLQASLDAISTTYGAYDRALVSAVSQRWYDLLEIQHFAYDRIGKVTVVFRLHPDGTITEAEITQNNVGQIWSYICLDAIEEAAPFAQWPADMRRMYSANFREITFTFYYIPD
jgi:outer membrane biosynthesis protein TonB